MKIGLADVKKLGTILGVWAHPDDESFLAAGLIAVAVQNGQKVACITATKGEEGQYDKSKYPEGKLGEVRAKELEAALKILGINDHHWLGYWDGKCDQVPLDEGVSRVLEFIKKYRPDTIVTFPPDGLTGHDDHKAVSRWAREAINSASRRTGRSAVQRINLLYAVDTREKYDDYFKEIDDKFNVYFNIDQPVLVPEAKCDIVLSLPPDLAKKKILALKAQPSQTEGMFKEFGEQLFIDALKTEAYIKADPADSSQWPPN